MVLAYDMWQGENSMTQNQYKCEACGATFDTQAELDRHNRATHSQYKCEVCGATFDSESELDAHNRSMHPERTQSR
jgi:DNA-directed RNA polymerase subunit RPC12/RpoP